MVTQVRHRIYIRYLSFISVTVLFRGKIVDEIGCNCVIDVQLHMKFE